ncbi:hypothetical protein CsSME_00000026 [Camellia sinensis var. sinensis]
MGIAELNRQAGINLGLAEIFHQYSIGSKEDGWVYYLRIRRRCEKIIKNTLDKDLNDDDFFWVSGNFEDHQAQIPGQNSAHLHSLYSYPNLATLLAALRYPERSWAKLLKFEPTYRYSGRRKARVTDFLLEEAPEPDPTLPEIRLFPLTAEEEMAKRNRVRALLTETNRPEVPPSSQTQQAVVALPSQQPSSSRPSKRARSTPTEQRLVDEHETTPPPIPQPEPSDRAGSSRWAPKLKFQNRLIQDTDSVVAEKDHLMAFNLAKSVCLPVDMEHHQNLTELKAIRSATKSMILHLGCGPETEVYNAPQYFIPASLVEYAASIQQQFLQGSDDEDEENEPTVTPVVNEQGNNQSARLEPTVEDLTVEPSTDIVLPVATETDLPSATGQLLVGLLLPYRRLRRMVFLLLTAEVWCSKPIKHEEALPPICLWLSPTFSFSGKAVRTTMANTSMLEVKNSKTSNLSVLDNDEPSKKNLSRFFSSILTSTKIRYIGFLNTVVMAVRTLNHLLSESSPLSRLPRSFLF